MNNPTLARELLKYAASLPSGGSNLYRVRSFRVAAEAIQRTDTPLAQILAERGRSGLAAIPSVGESIAYTLESLLEHGEVRVLREEEANQDLLRVPGIGRRLAERLRDTLGIFTCDELTRAYQQGKLEHLGLQRKRLAAIIRSIESRIIEHERPTIPKNEPSVDVLLRADVRFRELADDVELDTQWETQIGDWNLHIEYADTAIAHLRGKTRDWVVISFAGGVRTIVTKQGRRVVRGREAECQRVKREAA